MVALGRPQASGLITACPLAHLSAACALVVGYTTAPNRQATSGDRR